MLNIRSISYLIHARRDTTSHEIYVYSFIFCNYNSKDTCVVDVDASDSQLIGWQHSLANEGNFESN